MDQSYIMQLLPLKAKAEHALSNGNFESAQSFIAEFADKLAAPYESGDKSYEAIRFAYLGASNAALVLGKIVEMPQCPLISGPAEGMYRFSKKALEYTREIVNEKNTPDNYLAFVSSAAVYLKAADIYKDHLGKWREVYNDRSFTQRYVSVANKFSDKLLEHFPDNDDIKTVVKSYRRSKDNLKENLYTGIVVLRDPKYKEMDNRLDEQCEYIASIFAADLITDNPMNSMILNDLCDVLWYTEKKHSQYLHEIFTSLEKDSSLEMAKESGCLDLAMNCEGKFWYDILSDSFESYFNYCNENGIAPAAIKCVPFGDCVPYLEYGKAKELMMNAYKGLLSLYAANVFKGEVSVRFTQNELLKFIEEYCSDGALGQTLFIFVEIMLESDAVMIYNNMLSVKIEQCYLCKRLNDAQKFRSSAEELAGVLNTYIDRLEGNKIAHNLKRFTYKDILSHIN